MSNETPTLIFAGEYNQRINAMIGGRPMGLDAFVRCRCFEEHKLIDPPVPYEDLYVDPDGLSMLANTRTWKSARSGLVIGQGLLTFGEASIA